LHHVCDKQIKCPTSIRRWHFSREKNKNKGQEAKCATSIRKHLKKAKNTKEASQEEKLKQEKDNILLPL